MTEDEALEGALVPAPKPADIRYEDETPSDAVTNVIIRVERADGSVKEYEAREPQNWQMNDPESIGAQVLRTTGLGIAGGFGSVFGTPIAGTIFGLEVVSVGRMEYDALVPALVAALVGDFTTRSLGVVHTAYPAMPALELGPVLLA